MAGRSVASLVMAVAAARMAWADSRPRSVVQRALDCHRCCRQWRSAEDQSRLAMEAAYYYTGVNHELLLKQPEMATSKSVLPGAASRLTCDTSRTVAET